ncbi:MAG: PAS domain-containing protein [Nitrospirae bacterium]|nr:PAS domain-containing protein [Nitrospirota bacterium]
MSTGLQLSAALYALLLIRLTGRKAAWISISTALVLMTGHRIVSFISILSENGQMGLDIPELISLAVSCLMLLGVHLIRHNFLSINAAVTSRRQSEQELRWVTQRLELATRSSNLGVWDWDITNNIMTWDDQMLELYGITRETFPGGVDAWHNGLHPEDHDKVIEECEAALRGEKEWDTDFRVLHPDGTVKHIKANGMVIRDSDGTPIRMLGINYDITDRKRMEEQLLKSKEELELKVTERTKELLLTNEQLKAFAKDKEMLLDELDKIFALSSDMICIADINNGYFRKINPAWEKTLGYTREELLGKPFLYYVHPNDEEKTLALVNKTRASGTTVFDFENRYLCKDGTYRWLSWMSNTIAEKGITYAIARDITERKQSEEKLRKSERQLLESQRVAHLGNWDLNLGFQELEWSDETYRLFDKSPESFVPTFNEFARMVHPDDHATMEANWVKALESDTTPYHVAVRIINDSGRQWVMEAFGVVRRDSCGKALSIFGTAQDITERKKYEEQIHQSLREKETLLRELYHRTKNNMQVITSLLILQSRDIDDKKTLQILEDTKNRIYSMAMVHEKLYKAKNLSQVYLSDYIKDLACALMESHNADEEHVSLQVDVEMIPVSIETITPLGLVINELMTNALKHAFPDNRERRITITARLNEGEITELRFSDNGIGMPKNMNIRETESLGLTLVRTLVTQIDGELEMQTQNGTTFIIKFKAKGIPARI